MSTTPTYTAILLLLNMTDPLFLLLDNGKLQRTHDRVDDRRAKLKQ